MIPSESYFHQRKTATYVCTEIVKGLSLEWASHKYREVSIWWNAFLGNDNVYRWFYHRTFPLIFLIFLQKKRISL